LNTPVVTFPREGQALETGYLLAQGDNKLTLTTEQTSFLETLLPGCSADQISPGIASALLLLPEIEIREALTLCLFFCAHCIDHKVDISGPSLPKKSDLMAVADTCMLLSSTLEQVVERLGNDG